jgi:hypothetical protein
MSVREQNRWKGLVVGMLGGIAGVVAMRAYWQQVQRLTGRDPRTGFDETEVPDIEALDSLSIVGRHHREGESSTAAMGRIIYQQITGKEPGQETRMALSYIIHWVISMFAGGAYGATRTKSNMPDLAGGAILGTVLWLFGDETLMPLVGLTKGPTAYPLQLHIHSWGVHMAYGLASATATQLLYRLLPS